MVDRQPGDKSFDDALERALDKGAMLPASERLRPLTTRSGTKRTQRIVVDRNSDHDLVYMGE